MKGFTSIPAERVHELSTLAIAHIEELRKKKLEEAIEEEIKASKKQSFIQKLFGIIPKPISADEALLILKKEDMFASEYWWITNSYKGWFNKMQDLRKASLLVDGDILVDIETSAYLQKVEENK